MLLLIFLRKKLLEYNRVEIPCKYQNTEWFNLVLIGDVHEGNIGCCEKTLKRVIKYVKDTPNTFWIAMGDMLEAIVPSDKRFDIRTVAVKYQRELDNLVPEQIATTVERFKPITKNCLGWHRGGHCEKIRKFHHTDVLKEIHRHLGVKVYYDMAITRLRFYAENTRWSNSFDILSAHGNIAGRKEGGKINRLVDLMADHEADIYALGHGHTRQPVTKYRLYFDQAGEIQSRETFGTFTGSFLKAYIKGGTSYAEKAMYPPNSIGAVEFKINPRLGKIKHGLL